MIFYEELASSRPQLGPDTDSEVTHYLTVIVTCTASSYKLHGCKMCQTSLRFRSRHFLILVYSNVMSRWY